MTSRDNAPVVQSDMIKRVAVDKYLNESSREYESQNAHGLLNDNLYG